MGDEMKIGLMQVDGKYPNLALMKLSAWHKTQGDKVRLCSPIDAAAFDRVYASKVFTWSDDSYVPDKAERGGTGWNLRKLPEEVEHMCPDYELFNCDYAMGYLTRGCIRECRFCIVPSKEGKIKHNADVTEFWRGQKLIKLLDPNFTAHPNRGKYMDQLKGTGALIDFTQGLDARLIDRGFAMHFTKLKLSRYTHVAWDDMSHEKRILQGIRMLAGYLNPSRIIVYVLIGFDTNENEDLYRVEKLRDMGVEPFVMAYDRGDPYQKRLARWCNHKAIFKTVEWEDYNQTHAIK